LNCTQRFMRTVPSYQQALQSICCSASVATRNKGNNTQVTKMVTTHIRDFWILAVLSLALSEAAIGQEATTVKIRLTIDGKAIEATLLGNATAQDFVSLLPMT